LIELFEEIEREASKCINCGFCDSVCPTLPASGYKGHISARGRVNLANNLIKEIKSKGKIELSIDESYYSCLLCYACQEVCPVSINAGKISELGRRLIVKHAKNQQNKIAKLITKNIIKYKDPLGLTHECSNWAKNISFSKNSKNLLYTGHMYQLMAYSKVIEESILKRKNILNILLGLVSRMPFLIKFSKYFYDEDVKYEMENALKNIVKLLKINGIDFRYEPDEPYPGTLLLELGYEEEFAEYAKEVTNYFKEKGIERIIVIDPHTFEILKIHYPKYVSDFNFEVIYYLDLLDFGKFNKIEEEVTYHEPCHFVRRLNYTKPFSLLNNIAKMTLPAHSGRNTLCCGGPVALFYKEISDEIAERRHKELEETKASYIITACPICFVNLYKSKNVIDLSNFLNLTIKNDKL
jgi:glycolate oxidase iron-sulfur subunit